jgi:hypothetical protein
MQVFRENDKNNSGINFHVIRYMQPEGVFFEKKFGFLGNV